MDVIDFAEEAKKKGKRHKLPFLSKAPKKLTLEDLQDGQRMLSDALIDLHAYSVEIIRFNKTLTQALIVMYDTIQRIEKKVDR